MKMLLSEIAELIGAVGDFEEQGNALVTGIQTDSRLVRPGDIFVCLSGERFDGHNFAQDSLQRGAVAVIAQRPIWNLPEQAAVLLVQDCLAALGRLAAFIRRKFEGQVIAVTGSAGKTTVKELLASILSQKASCAKNYKNWNNQLGLPLSIFSFSGEEDFWVLEAGVSLEGDMDDLGLLLAPGVAIIHNIGPAHLEGLGDLEGVVREKTKLLQYMSSSGQVVFSLDYPLLKDKIHASEPSLKLGFSCQDSRAAYYGKYCGPGHKDKGHYELYLDGQELSLELPWQSSYMTENIMAAVCTARLLGAGKEHIEVGLKKASLPEHRCQMQTIGSLSIIDDSYNANPLSMRYALENAAELSSGKPLIAVLGDMYELGSQAEIEHENLGKMAARVGCNKLFYVGKHSAEVRSGLQAEGAQTEVIHLKQPEELAKVWPKQGLDSATVLFKGSRACQLESYLKHLLESL